MVKKRYSESNGTMITDWIERKKRDRLLIFFNGWGMDNGITGFLRSNTPAGFDHDILHCYDYRSTVMPAEVLDDIARYSERTLVAWSLGVWAASRAGLKGIDRALALNGTLKPVSRDEGIAPELFQATLDNYDEENKQRFMRRMCGSAELFQRFLDHAPKRSARDQKDELALIQQSVLRKDKSAAPSWNYTHALIGRRDMIFPPSAQAHAWRGVAQKTVESMPHFPFFEFSNWQELCGCMEE